MAKVYAFLADGMEEVECLGVCDVLARAGVEVKLVSVMGRCQVTGSCPLYTSPSPRDA